MKVNKKLLSSTINELERFEEVYISSGGIARDLRRYGDYQEKGLKITREDEPAFIYYAGLAILCRDINNSLPTLSDEDRTFLKGVLYPVIADDKERWGPSAFPYDDPVFPFKEWLSLLPDGITADAAQSLSKIRSVGELNLVHEWTVKPGKRLFMKFIDKFGRKFKESICCGENSPYDLFKKNKGLPDLHKKCVMIALTVGAISPASIWYPIAGYVGFILVKTGLKMYCEP